MADVGNNLRIKFGLRNNPSIEQQRQWANVVDLLVKQGYSLDLAGQMAAKQLFPDFGQMVYASEGDTIEMLLQRIRDR